MINQCPPHLQCVAETLAIDNIAIASGIKYVRVLTVHGSEDTATPVQDAYSLHKHLPADSKLCIIQGADHCFTQHASEMVAAVTDFLTAKRACMTG